MNDVQELVDYLAKHDLKLATAESCTAGKIIDLLGSCPGSGSYLDAGYVVYSPEAKTRLLGVTPETIETYGLTSEEVSSAMAKGALRDSEATVALATTGVAGPEPMGDIPPGTVCFAWGFRINDDIKVYTETRRFEGDRSEVIRDAALYALDRIPTIRSNMTKGEANP